MIVSLVEGKIVKIFNRLVKFRFLDVEAKCGQHRVEVSDRHDDFFSKIKFSLFHRARKHYFKVLQKSHNHQKHSQSSKLESQPSTSSYKEQSDQEYLLSWTVGI